MEITLEKIELVKERTGASYKEAKEALENVDGSVVEAIISLEAKLYKKEENKIGEKGALILEAIKETVALGNASKVRVTNEDGEVILSIPVNVGLVGTFIAPWGAIIATTAAFSFKCTIEVVKTDGTIIDISERAKDGVNTAVEKGSDAAESVKGKASDVVDKVTDSDIYEKVTTSDAFEKLKEKKSSVGSKIDGIIHNKKDIEEFAEDFMDDIDDEIIWEREATDEVSNEETSEESKEEKAK